ncbi:MAG: MATE family efflux transporter [Lachnospiraceae bacterium]|nr:MATE family efflux transporter [Lachnospiraceae bacterium]
MSETNSQKNDFSKGSVVGSILSLAIPMTLAQLINILYNIIDRMYIGRLPENATLSLTGLGLCLPIISIVIAFANLFGMGGAPLCSIARGKGQLEEAQNIMGNSFFMLLLSGFILTAVGLIFKRPLLYLFGASDATFPFANEYLSIYLCGSIFVMLGLGMNSFINSQGFGRIGMLTVLIGAVLNILLDPLFIFVFNMGIRGAAVATVISQAASALWTFRFLRGEKTILRLKLSAMKLRPAIVKDVISLGMSGFIMSMTNSAVQIVCNASLSHYGGDLYVGVMTIINSIREIVTMPVSGITNGAQPVIGFNYGAARYDRIKRATAFMSAICIGYTALVWICLHVFPAFFIGIFSEESSLIDATIPSMRIYFFGFVFMSLQFSGQSVFTALGKARQAIFFSLLRKAFIVIPLTFLLPHLITPQVNGVFAAEPISNLLGGTACFVTMLILTGREFKLRQKS